MPKAIMWLYYGYGMINYGYDILFCFEQYNCLSNIAASVTNPLSTDHYCFSFEERADFRKISITLSQIGHTETILNHTKLFSEWLFFNQKPTFKTYMTVF